MRSAFLEQGHRHHTLTPGMAGQQLPAFHKTSATQERRFPPHAAAVTVDKQRGHRAACCRMMKAKTAVNTNVAAAVSQCKVASTSHKHSAWRGSSNTAHREPKGSKVHRGATPLILETLGVAPSLLSQHQGSTNVYKGYLQWIHRGEHHRSVKNSGNRKAAYKIGSCI